MKTVTKWIGYEEAKRRAEAQKARKTLKPLSSKKGNKQSKSKKQAKRYVSFCGGIQPLPILLPIDEEE